MPATLRNVAKTDTLETQRQKINLLAQDVYNIGSGGSDLSAGNIKLGDGTRTVPSLAFTSDESLGIYKPSAKTIGYVVDGKKLLDVSSTRSVFYKNLILQKNILNNSGIVISNAGSNYDGGTYSDIPLIGGTGDLATLDITVEKFTGNVTNAGSGYIPGSYSNIPLKDGSGTASFVNFTVPGIIGTIFNAGSGYTDGFYNGISLSGGSGSGAVANIVINSGVITTVNITSSGSGYLNNEILSVSSADVGGTGSGFQYKITNFPGSIQNLVFFQKGNGYQVSDTLHLNNTVSGISTTLSTSSATITVSSTSGIYPGYVVNKTSGSGVLAANTTVLSVNNSTTITLSANPTTAGSATLSFVPPYGNVSGANRFEYTINSIGSISNITVNNPGNGYSNSDVLTVNSTDLVQAIEYSVKKVNVQVLTFTGTVSSSAFSIGQFIKDPGGSISTLSITTNNTIAGQASQVYTNVTGTTSGSGINAKFTVTRGFDGSVSSVVTTSTGNLYATSDTITIPGNQIGGSSPTNNIVLTVGNVTPDGSNKEIFSIKTSGSNISSIIVEDGGFQSNNIVVKSTSNTPYYTLNTVSSENRFFIDTGSGYAYSPSITLYSGNTYKFLLNDNSLLGHNFLLSSFRDGIWSPSLIENITSTLTYSPQITVSNTTGIIAGMEVVVTSGSGAIPLGTTVVSVIDSSTLLLSNTPTSIGASVLSFKGKEYTTGITKSSNSLTLKVSNTTPTLYYYCNLHPNMGGSDNDEGTFSISTSNPKVFGSGFSVLVNSVSTSESISTNVLTGNITATSFTGSSASLQSATLSSSLSSPTISTTTLTTANIFSTNNITTTCPIFNVVGNLLVGNIGLGVQIDSLTGNLTASGIIKSISGVNVNDIISITNNTISCSTGYNLQLSPATGFVTRINSTSALLIPAGNTSQRPTGSNVGNGAIRYNSDSGQYEGYSATTSSWSSLGGVRDLDGNTYISAEASVGANDNTLYFYNDNLNTIKTTPSDFIFNVVKNINSLNILAPDSVAWSANTPVTVGQYLNYGFNVYEVTSAGTTASSSNPPTHSSGVASNGTAQLTWNSSYVDALTFSKISQVNIGTANIPTTLVVNGGLKLFGDTVSTITNDLILQPYSGKKAVINATSSLVIPSGNTSQRGIPAQGSIRYSTTLSSFEGYNGTNWTSLGGVKDVDGNTYIIPETFPGSNENILYFYNNGNNTLRVTESDLQFRSIDAITSLNNNLDLNVETITFNSLAFTLDNTGSTTTKLLSTRTNLDFALSSGVTSDPLVRLNSSGDILVNKTYSTGSNTFIKVLDNELKTVELDDVKIETTDLILTKGSTDFGLITIFTPSIHSGAKVVLIADNVTTNDREVIEYNVISKNDDIYHTEYGNVTSGLDIINAAFDFDGSGNVRLTPTLISSLSSGNVVNITAIKTIFKK